MAQWINLLQNNRSVLHVVSVFVVLKTGPVHLVLVVLVGLMSVRLAVCQSSRPDRLPAVQQFVSPSDENLLVIKIFKIHPCLKQKTVFHLQTHEYCYLHRIMCHFNRTYMDKLLYKCDMIAVAQTKCINM